MPLRPYPTARVGALQIEYQLADFTDPWRETPPQTILFHHGFCRNMDFWRAWVPLLASDYRVLLFNSRGCGATSAPDPKQPYTVEQLVGDALGLLDALGIDKAHWVGESSGGIVGLATALSHPERLQSLTLCNTPFKIEKELSQRYDVGEADFDAAIAKHGVGGWCRETLAYRLDLKRASKAMQEWYIAQMDKVSPFVAVAHHRMAGSGDFGPRLPEIKLPTLILVGENSPIARKDKMEQMQRDMPNAKLAVFEGYGHGINLLAPQRCVDELRTFLAERVGAGTG